MSMWGQYWRKIQGWWEEYYTDNPVVWLLYQQMTYTNLLSFSSKAQQVEKELRQAYQARDLDAIQSLQQVQGTLLQARITLQPFWKRSDPWIAVLFWGFALLTALVIYLKGWHTVLQSALADSAVIWIILGIALGILAFGYGALLRSLFLRERMQGTDIFLWLTRIGGRHLVLGALTALALRHQVRPYLIFVAPFVWLLGTLWQGNWLYGLWLVVSLGGWCAAFAVFWQMVSTFTLPASANNWVNLTLYWLYVAFIVVVWCFPLLGLFSATTFREAVQQVRTAPVWLWWLHPIWWLSLPLHIGVALLSFVAHPLWGIPQGLVCLGLAFALMPLAIRFAERARLLREPTPPQEEGW